MKAVEMKNGNEIKYTVILCTVLFFLSFNSSSQWVHLTNVIGSEDTYSLVSNGTKLFAGTYSKGVYYSTNNGTNWVQTSLTNRDVRSLAIIGNYVIAGTRDHGIYYSSNNGTNWSQSNLVTEDVWCMAAKDSYVFAGTNHTGVYVSANNGINWSQTSLQDMTVNALCVSGNNILAAGGVGGWGVFASANNGASWTLIGDIGIGLYSIASNGSNIYIGPYYAGLYLSTDYGVHWAETSLDIGTVAAIAYSGNSIFAGMEGFGFKVSNDNGSTWTSRSEGLGSGYISALIIINNQLYAATGNGVYKRPLNELIGIQCISSEIPEKFKLFQNYPNPFNPSTKIRFDVSGTLVAQTFLSVYDILGREIATLVNKQLPPGTYEVDFDGTNLPSGIYFYRLTAGEFSAVNKMVLTK